MIRHSQKVGIQNFKTDDKSAFLDSRFRGNDDN